MEEIGNRFGSKGKILSHDKPYGKTKSTKANYQIEFIRFNRNFTMSKVRKNKILYEEVGD